MPDSYAVYNITHSRYEPLWNGTGRQAATERFTTLAANTGFELILYRRGSTRNHPVALTINCRAAWRQDEK